MAFRTDDHQAAQFSDAWPEFDVRAAASHVGGNGDHALLAGVLDDFRFFFVVFGVEHVVDDIFLIQELAEDFRLVDGRRADQDRLARSVALLDFPDDGAVLGVLRLVDDVRQIAADSRFVGRDDVDVEFIDLVEFVFFRLGRTGHAGQLVVHTEVVLEGNRSQGLAFALDLDVFLGFDGLMQAIAVTAAEHEAACEFIDDDDFAVLDDVILIAVHHEARPQGLDDEVVQIEVVVVEHVADAQHLFNFGNTRVGRRDGLLFFVHRVVVFGEGLDDACQRVVQVRRFFTRAGNDERRPRFVDEDRVHFVDDTIIERPLYHLVFADDHVIAQVVEPEFVVRPIGDVGVICPAALVIREVVDDEPDGQTEELIDAAHVFTVTSSQVVIDGDDVDALPRQGIEVNRQRRDQGLAFTRTHFGDIPAMEDDTPQELDVKMAHPCHTARSFADDGKGFGQNVVQRFTVGQTILELEGLLLQRRIAQACQLRFQIIDAADNGPHLL